MLSQEIHFLASESIRNHLNMSITKFCRSIRGRPMTTYAAAPVGHL